MAELLVASGSKKISALTSVSGISGSTAMPIVMGGNTVQVTHTNFLATTLLNQSNTFSGNNTFGGQTTLLNGLVNGNLVVKGDLTANQYIISSSISHITTAFSSGSTKFGDSLDDTHQFTGSVSITGSFLVNGIGVDGSSINAFTQSINIFSASVADEVNSLQDVTASYTLTSSFNQYTASNDDIVNSLISVTGSYATTSSLNSLSSSVESRLTINEDLIQSLEAVTGSYATTASFNEYTASNDDIVNSLISVTGSYATTGSNTFIGNQIITGSVGVSGSVNADIFTLDASLTANVLALNSQFNLDLSGSVTPFIYKTLVLGSGKVLVAGRFESIDGHTTNDIARLNADGTVDTSFTATTIGGGVSATSQYINNFVTESNGKIIAVGSFTSVNGLSRSGVARFSEDGVHDTSLTNPAFSSFTEVRDVAIQNDDKIVVVGRFDGGIKRLQTNGTIDASLSVTDTTGFTNDTFYSVALLPSGSGEAILVGGNFTQWNTSSNYDYIVKLDPSGSLDTGFAGTNLNISTGGGLDRIKKIKVTDAYSEGDNGYIYIAGRFKDTLTGPNVRHAGFARLTTEDEGFGRGAFDSGFRTYISGSDQNLPGVSLYVNDFDFYDTDEILLGGNFITIGIPGYATTSANRFAIVSQNTGNIISGWSASGSASTYNLNTGSVNSVTLLPNNNVLVGGTFTSASNPSTAREGLASLKLAGLGVVTTTTDYSITADTQKLLVSSSNTFFSGDVNISGSVTAATFIGDGSGLTGVTAGGVDFDDITNKPTLFSSSIQVDADTITNFDANVLAYNNSLGVVSGSSQVSYPDLSNIPNGIISSSTQVLDYDIFTTTSSFNSFTSSYNTGSFTGSFVGDGSGLTGVTATIPNGIVSSSTQVLNYGIFATTGSNTFIGNQIISGGLNLSGSITNINSIRFNQTAGVSVAAGEMAWNNSDGTLDIGLKGGNVTLQVGQETLYEVRNDTGVSIPAGTSLFANGVTAGSGRITAEPFVADGSIREVRYLGLATETIGTGVNGFVTHFGYVRGLDTRGTTASSIAVGDEDWQVGDILYAHPTVAGKLTSILPKHEIIVAIVVVRHQTTGVLFVRPSSFGHLEDNHDVNINTASLSTGDLLVYDGVDGNWRNTTTLSGSYQITGSFDVTGSLNIDNKVRVENGYSILTQVSQSLEFANDTDAAAGGVPLGGLYRSGNFILIRLV